MLKQSKRNYLQRGVYKQMEVKILLLKILTTFNHSISNAVARCYMQYEMKRLCGHIKGSSRIKSVCILSGRSRGVYRLFRLSRINIREKGNAGFLMGLSKAS